VLAEGAARQRVGVALYGDVTHDSRVRREAATLARAGHAIRLICLGSSGDDRDLGTGVSVLARRPPGRSNLPGAPNPWWSSARHGPGRLITGGRWLGSYAKGLRAWGRLAAAAAGPVDIWHVHDLPALVAMAPVIPRGLPIVYDSHELFLEAGTAARLPSPVRSLLGAYERRLVSRVAAIVTVNDELGRVLRGRYPGRRIVVVHNCPERWTPRPDARDILREAAGIPPDVPVILHHGSLGANRGIEQLIEALVMPGLERAHLVLMGGGEVRSRYVSLVAGSSWRDRIHVLDPVPPSELLDWVASADVGAMPIQRSTLNHYLSTPNKLFECLAAGVPVVASDFPAMRRIVTDDPAGQLGAVCDPASVGSLAAAIRSVLDCPRRDGEELRARCRAAAHREWNWETQSAELLALYSELGRSARPVGGRADRSVASYRK
jgi:glycosyltransferase involved in cell wall biosynthesis